MLSREMKRWMGEIDELFESDIADRGSHLSMGNFDSTEYPTGRGVGEVQQIMIEAGRTELEHERQVYSLL